MVTQVRADDLTAIRGIGASRQRWLAQEFGVRTYVQLAALAPDEIEARLKSAGTVSYTHLDVYKRQRLTRPRSRIRVCR